MIALKNVSKAYGEKMILSGVSLRIDPGACICIAGDNDSGKTTLLRLLIRAEDPTSGSVEVDGVTLQILPPPVLQLYRRRVGIIFQEQILVDHLTVEENLALPLTVLNAPESLIKRNTADLLRRIGLTDKAALFPKDLHSSERSLLCIARALITAPMVILADEPFQNLNSAQTELVTDLLLNMKKKGTTVVLFVRDAGVASAFSAQVLTLKNGQLGAQNTEPANAQKTVPADAHRILEETETPPAAFTPAEETEAKIAVKEKAPSKKRIRITSIGSNS